MWVANRKLLFTIENQILLANILLWQKRILITVTTIEKFETILSESLWMYLEARGKKRKVHFLISRFLRSRNWRKPKCYIMKVPLEKTYDCMCFFFGQLTKPVKCSIILMFLGYLNSYLYVVQPFTIIVNFIVKVYSCRVT